MAFLAPLFFVALAAIAIPVYVHLIQRERKDVIEFPSLMFIRKIPYQSVERRRIHNWWLLLMRLAAIAMIVAAFARPFFEVDPVKAAAAATGAREVVILLDRSASMGYGDHWSKAKDQALKIAGSLGGEDRATLFLFDSNVEEAVRATSDVGSLTAGINNAAVSSGATRFAPVLRQTQSLLSRSDRGRKEAFLISDFQKSGWERQEEIHLPDGATITPISVAELVTADLAVTSVALKRAAFSGEERVTITAGLSNRSADAVKQAVTLEIDGRTVATKEVSIPPNATGSVTYEAVTVADANMRGAIHAGSDAMPKDNNFYFVLSPSRPVSVLIIDAEGADRARALFLSTALGLSKTPPFKTEVTTPSRITSSMLDGRALVVLNDATTLSTASAAALVAFVQRGGGLLAAFGEHTPVSADSPLLPGTLGAPVERIGTRGGTLGYLDYSHPIFEGFKDPRNGNFANMRFQRYRTLTPAATDHVLARYDDGAVALVERKVGNGRVLVWTSTLDISWNDAPRHAMFLPLMHETAGYLAQYEEPQAWQPVGRILDMSAPISAVMRQGATGTLGSSGVAVSPSGSQVTLGQSGAKSIELSEQGFYSVRLAGSGDRRPYAVAVNLEAAESDLSALMPTEFLAAATNSSAAVRGGQSLDSPEATPVDVEKKQAIWWFLLVAGLLALFGESVLSNIQSRRFGFGTAR